MNTQPQTSSGSGRTGLKYFLVGSGIGAAAALLFAPKSGSDLRNDITDVTKRGYDGTLDMARKVKDQSTDLYHSFIEGKRGKEIVNGAVSAAKDLLDDASDDPILIDDAPRSTHLAGRSTNIV